MTPHNVHGRSVISICPVCESDLQVTRLHCNTCGTTIEGEFSVGRFAQLDREQMAILEGFLRARGNLRELERELRLSYPTVRARVEAVLRVLGFTEPAPAEEEPDLAETAPASSSIDAGARREILERLARRELTPEQASAALRGEAPPVEEADR
ncbi:MAG TPA: DUF2089 domain-containing protein [Candidatus Limnocylindria bacterium]|jgi:hypothetical protein|nr:DUF2089 domain-containing protein [Candidatus Limnocylindria bacterium]